MKRILIDVAALAIGCTAGAALGDTKLAAAQLSMLFVAGYLVLDWLLRGATASDV